MADVRVQNVGFDGAERGHGVVGRAARGRSRRPVPPPAVLTYHGYTTASFSSAPLMAVERRQRRRERAVLLLGTQRRESVAEPAPRDHDEREERHEQNQQELRSEAQPREHSWVLPMPVSAHRVR